MFVRFCLLEIVGETITGLSTEGSCFPDNHFLPIFLRIFLFCFIFVFVLYLFFFFLEMEKRPIFSLYLFSPVLAGYVHFAARKIKFHVFAAPIYPAIFVVKTSPQFFVRKFEVTRSFCVDMLCAS